MINRFIEASLRNRVLVVIVYVGLAVWGYWALQATPIDAIPDLSDNQVIVFTDWTGHSPQEVEDQVTYPLTVNLQGLAGVRVVRSQSAFGFSMIYVVFEDNIDLYFARSRVLERMSLVTKTLADRRHADAWSGCHRGRARVLVHGREPDAATTRAPIDSGLVHPLPAERRAGRRGGRVGWRIRPAIPGGRRSDSASLIRRAAQRGCDGRSRQQHERRRQRARSQRGVADGSRHWPHRID